MEQIALTFVALYLLFILSGVLIFCYEYKLTFLLNVLFIVYFLSVWKLI